MTSTALPISGSADLSAMAGIEARRLARSPIFLSGVVLAFGVLALMAFLNEDPYFVDLLSIPVIPAFFIGLTSLVATHRLTRSGRIMAWTESPAARPFAATATSRTCPSTSTLAPAG